MNPYEKNLSTRKHLLLSALIHKPEVNGLLFTSGVIPIVPSTGELVEGDIEAQAEQAIGKSCCSDRSCGSKD